MSHDDEDDGDAAQAFEDLRAEVSVLRRAVEALPEAWAAQQPADLSPEVGRILQGVTAAVVQLESIRRHLALTMTPEQYVAAIGRAGGSVMRDAAHQLDRATQEAERARQQLGYLIEAALTRAKQRRVVAWTAGVALAAGLLLSPIFIRALPLGAASHVAAFLVGADRWESGALLMQLAAPERWPGVVDALRLIRTNDAALAACREQAAKAKREQRCTVAVPAP